MSCMWMGVPGSADVSTHASAELVVPRSMPTTKREVTGWVRSGHFDFRGRDDVEARGRQRRQGHTRRFPSAVTEDARTPRIPSLLPTTLIARRVDVASRA